MLTAALFLLLLAPPEDAVRTVLDDQAAAWNKGDLIEYMKTYDDSDQTVFMGASGVTKGHSQVLARYRERYGTREKMGTLSFSNVDVRALDARHATATGRFQLNRAAEAGGNASGWFSLVLVRTPHGWKIILDHTS